MAPGALHPSTDPFSRAMALAGSGPPPDLADSATPSLFRWPPREGPNWADPDLSARHHAFPLLLSPARLWPPSHATFFPTPPTTVRPSDGSPPSSPPLQVLEGSLSPRPFQVSARWITCSNGLLLVVYVFGVAVGIGVAGDDVDAVSTSRRTVHYVAKWKGITFMTSRLPSCSCVIFLLDVHQWGILLMMVKEKALVWYFHTPSVAELGFRHEGSPTCQLKQERSQGFRECAFVLESLSHYLYYGQ
ncbi:hypothetical protein E2562_028619 [Oryza meyeriana var. granulata]|uniref:Uncharacterized protein n=1 Tax=Oryza meyeriana var. granulata TaxID=110450 RepID=A0A6G1FD29_9ORYZ|nr:hypothetical protein E2562_028619 [Oryza meyeriana var. granulata]